MRRGFKKLDFALRKFSKVIDSYIKEVLASFVDKKHQGLVKYHFLTGGKRLRPVLAIVSCRMLGGKTKDVLRQAAGLEILHNYTLIIDDIIDNSTLRRGSPTVWSKFGRSIAECVSWAFAASAFQAAAKVKRPAEVAELFAESLKAVMDGEIMDILFEQSGREDEPYVVENRYYKVTEKDYFMMVGGKTAHLFGTCCALGAMAAGASKKDLASLRKYGFNLGLVFQIKDDILDIFGKQETFGKVIGGDIVERKLGNIVILKSFREFSSADKKNFLAILRKGKVTAKDVKKGIAMIAKTNSRKESDFLARGFLEKAKKELRGLPDNVWRGLLFKLADFVMDREK
ncbi:MAG: hypothetical protein G01um101430_14 [Parcubacteria group bacterium Gr01-1014_30]|nr:MAG: hypothetical protein G01um101430_14 [Parcubacteria group bacterium Gr01-1014_30]